MPLDRLRPLVGRAWGTGHAADRLRASASLALALSLSSALALALGAGLGATGCAEQIPGLIDCEVDADCPHGYCDQVSHYCASGQRECDVDTQCGAPERICDGGRCVLGCAASGCDLGEVCNPATGRCRFPVSCTIDSSCQPPQSICLAGTCEAGCGLTGCAVGYCDPYSGRCQGGTGCAGDAECAPPATICEGGQCVAGCTSIGCGTGLACNQATGRCDPVAGLKGDGEDCTGNTECLSGLCRHIEVYHGSTLGWQPFDVCTTECCTELDCVSGSACLYHDGAKICIPDRIYPSGYVFDLAAGQTCGSGTHVCRSGFCNPQTLRCASTCCESSDCTQNGLCSWYPDATNQVLWELCRDQGSIGFGTQGSPCQSEYDCQSFVCLTPQMQCADLCCTNTDCPGGHRCAQIVGAAGGDGMATTVCVQTSIGPTADGGACNPGDAPSTQCASGLCVGAGVCRSPCCHDSDCGTGLRCTTVPSGVDLDSDGQSDWVRACVP